MKFSFSKALIASLLLFSTASLASAGELTFELVSAKKIWDQAPHNAFTDLIRFNDRWFCVFREGTKHVSPDGAMRVITSKDGESWESAALLTSPTSDLRDAKIVVTPDGQLMLSGAEALHDQTEHSHKSLAWFSDDGFKWSESVHIGEPDFWLWRTTWHKGAAYNIGYATRSNKDATGVRLYKSEDGKNFNTLVSNLRPDDYPNETSMVFTKDDTCYCLLRRDKRTPTSEYTGILGIAKPPYTDWKWKDLGTRIGGPHMIQIPTGELIAAVRLYDKPVRTSVCVIDPVAGSITEKLKLPSGGDTSYAGLVWHEDQLWVSYYSSHEGKTQIYLARVKISSKSE